MSVNEIRVKVNNGYLVARRNPDRDYDGIYIAFETEDGNSIDIVVTECKTKYNKEMVDVYCYADLNREEFTRKFTVCCSGRE